jgi:hypothetical protein
VDPTIHPARSYRLLLFSCEETTPPSLLTPSIPRAPGKATELPCAHHPPPIPKALALMPYVWQYARPSLLGSRDVDNLWGRPRGVPRHGATFPADG